MARPYQVSALNNLVPYRELYKTITQTVYTVQPEDNNDVIIFNATANATLNLPPAAAVEGMIIRIWNNNTSTFNLTIDPHGAELIDGVSTLVLEVNEGTKCQAYQGRWFTRRINAADLYNSGTIAGSSKQSVLRYNGVTLTAGAFDGGSGTPSATTRLNYNGYLYATRFVGDGSQLTGISAGGTITNDTTTDATRYILFDDVTSGSATTVGVSSTKLYFNPSSGTLNATVFNSLSDETLKKNITKIENAIDLLKLLEGVEFQWKENDKKSAGLIAQWIEKILPHLVDENLDNGIKTVNYSGLIAYLIESIKELDERVKKLEGK